LIWLRLVIYVAFYFSLTAYLSRLFLDTYYLSHLSSWTVVVVTVERAVHVGLPLTAKV